MEKVLGKVNVFFLTFLLYAIIFKKANVFF